jgi:hypothetical protein
VPVERGREGDAHCLEYAALRAGHAAHIKTGMVASVVITTGSCRSTWG